MSERLKALVKALTERPAFPVYGAHIAASYLLTIDPIIRGKQLVTDFGEIGDVTSWEKSLNDAKGKLVWVPDEQETIQLVGEELTKAKADSAYVEKMTNGSIFDAVTILTSKKQDRDGDILEPDGADIDQKMPWLWQHIQISPIGKFVRTVLQDKALVKVHYALADTLLARDAATLSAFGGLRTSHGFMPKEWEELPRDKNRQSSGWHFTKYLVYEGSSVSIPSNTDAELTAFSREKLFHPLVLAHAKSLMAQRPKQVSVSGLDIPVNLKLAVQLTHENPPPAESPTAGGNKGIGGNGPLPGSWEETTSALNASCKNHLMTNGVDVRSNDYCAVPAMFDKQAIIAHQYYKGGNDYYSSGYDTDLYRCNWKMGDDGPEWTGQPKPVEVRTELVDAMKGMVAHAVKAVIAAMTPDEVGRLMLRHCFQGKTPSAPILEAITDSIERQKKDAEETVWQELSKALRS